MPISYILWCHARTYNRMILDNRRSAPPTEEEITTVDDDNMSTVRCSGEKVQNEAVCDVFCTDSDDDLELDTGSKEGEYGTESSADQSQTKDNGSDDEE